MTRHSPLNRRLLEERYSPPSWFHRDDEPERLEKSRQMLLEIAPIPAWPRKPRPGSDEREGD